MNIPLIRSSTYRVAGLAVALAASMGLAQAAGSTSVTRAFIVQVPPAQDHAFNEGMKAYEKCLRDHATQVTTLAYSAETGDLSRYLFLNTYSSWAAMDAHSMADQACGATFAGQVLPHVGQAFSEVAVLNDKESYMPGGDPDPAPMMWVDAYRIKTGAGAAFSEAVTKLAAAAAKTHWDGHWSGWDTMGGGQGAEDFVMVWPNKNWADIGQDPSPSAKDMMVGVYGADAAKSGHERFVASVAEEWSDVWSYNKDLSLIPGK